MPVKDLDRLLPKIDALNSRHGPELAHFALDWALGSSGVSGAVLGPSRPEHLDVVEHLTAAPSQTFSATTIW